MKKEDPIEEDVKKLISYKKNLIDPLSKVENLKFYAAEKGSLAWLLERMSHEKPETWENDLKNLKDDINKLNVEGGRVLVSQRMCEIINLEYIKFIKELIENEQSDTNYRRNLETVVEMSENALKRLMLKKVDGQTVVFGPVSMSFYPKWFQQNE